MEILGNGLGRVTERCLIKGFPKHNSTFSKTSGGDGLPHLVTLAGNERSGMESFEANSRVLDIHIEQTNNFTKFCNRFNAARLFQICDPSLHVDFVYDGARVLRCYRRGTGAHE